jgi:outer membrane protein assembly factor BamB
LNPKERYNPTLRFVASPLAVEGMIIVPSAKRGPVIALKPERLAGDVTGREEARHWIMKQNTPDVPSPLVKDGLAYLCRENGNLMCLDAQSGELLYEERTQRDRHRASPVYVDGKILLTARRGNISVVRPGRKFELLATNSMGEDISASPVVSGGRIYLRTFDALYAIGKK